MTLILYLVIAMVIGFAASRAGLCMVKAIEEILTTHHVYLIIGFVKTVAWVYGVTLTLLLIFNNSFANQLVFEYSHYAVIGGLIFGAGAALNSGCSISTLTRLGTGDMGMAVSLIGLSVGLYGAELIRQIVGVSHAKPSILKVNLDSPLFVLIWLAVLVWMVFEIVRLFKNSSQSSWYNKIIIEPYRISTAAMLMGISNGILYAFVGPWTYTYLVKNEVSRVVFTKNAIDPHAIVLWALFLALIVGTVLSSMLRRKIKLLWKPNVNWANYFFGGTLMGVGAALVPGGNDVLMFHGMPSLSSHAFPAFIAMLIGVTLTLVILNFCGKDWQKIDCSSDICK